jgi:hypothetical protein
MIQSNLLVIHLVSGNHDTDFWQLCFCHQQTTDYRGINQLAQQVMLGVSLLSFEQSHHPHNRNSIFSTTQLQMSYLSD